MSNWSYPTKVVIFAGGLGTRFSEKTELMPKPMIEIGNMPILWHIMKIYSEQGFNDFIILGGYKCNAIKEFFSNYYLHKNDVTFDIASNSMEIHNNNSEPWKVTVLNTGEKTMTGSRLWKAKDYLKGERFLLTYGDGVSDIDLHQLCSHHITKGKLVTLTSVMPAGRFGGLTIDDNDNVVEFKEKPKGDGNYINGGFFVVDPDIFNYIDNPYTCVFEDVLEQLAHEDKLSAYKHDGFWMAMDKANDKAILDKLIDNNEAPWITW